MNVYVCSPYGGQVENYEKARKYGRYIVSLGHVPIIPHTMLHGVLNDANPAERKKGLDAGKKLMRLCDEVWVFGVDVTPGMAGEIMEASQLKKPIKEIKRLPDGPTRADAISICLKEYGKYFNSLINSQVVYDIEHFIKNGVSSELIILAMKKAARKAAAWNYAYGILKNCLNQNIFTAEEFEHRNTKNVGSEMQTGDIGEIEKLINKGIQI